MVYLLDHLEELICLIEALSFLLHLLLEALPFVVELSQLVLYIGFTFRITDQQLLTCRLGKLFDALFKQLWEGKKRGKKWRKKQVKSMPKISELSLCLINPLNSS